MGLNTQVGDSVGEGARHGRRHFIPEPAPVRLKSCQVQVALDERLERAVHLAVLLFINQLLVDKLVKHF